MNFIMPSVFLIFSIIFYYVGVAYYADIEVLVSATLVMIAGTIAFAIPARFNTSSFLSLQPHIASQYAVYISMIIITCLFAIAYVANGVPILSSNVEVDRMVLVNKYGVLYRVATQFIFFLLPAILTLFYKKSISASVCLFSLLFLTVLLFSMGFRSRLIDFLGIALVTLTLLEIHRGSLRLKFILKAVVLGMFLSMLALFAITYMTYVREGHVFLADALDTVFHRAFLLNYLDNFNRVFLYADEVGLYYGLSFLRDPMSVLPIGLDSSQVEVTKYFNPINSHLFIMTPTIYGEFYLNFGIWCFLFVFPVIFIYRYFFEVVVRKATQISSGVGGIALIVNYLYYVPRIVVTGGVANSFVIKGISILIVFVMFLGIQSMIRTKIRK